MAELAGSTHAATGSRTSSESFESSSGTTGRDQVALLGEVRLLAEYIDRTRRDIAALGADRILKSHVLTATDQLDAIVIHTAEATSTILDVCEKLDSSPTLAAHEMVSAATARIYEACSFQDITGQRVVKVVETLQAIESKVTEILHVFGDGSQPKSSPRAQQPANTLLSGPQQPGTAMDQSAVDALLDKQA